MAKIGHTLRLRLGALDRLRGLAAACGLIHGGIGSASQLIDELADMKGAQRAALIQLIKDAKEERR